MSLAKGSNPVESPDRIVKSQIERVARLAVRVFDLQQAVGFFRTTMVEEALGLCQRSHRGAAKILGVSRPAIQHFVRSKAGESKEKDALESESDGPMRRRS